MRNYTKAILLSPIIFTQQSYADIIEISKDTTLSSMQQAPKDNDTLILTQDVVFTVDKSTKAAITTSKDGTGIVELYDPNIYQLGSANLRFNRTKMLFASQAKQPIDLEQYKYYSFAIDAQNDFNISDQARTFLIDNKVLLAYPDNFAFKFKMPDNTKLAFQSLSANANVEFSKNAVRFVDLQINGDGPNKLEYDKVILQDSRVNNFNALDIIVNTLETYGRSSLNLQNSQSKINNIENYGSLFLTLGNKDDAGGNYQFKDISCDTAHEISINANGSSVNFACDTCRISGHMMVNISNQQPIKIQNLSLNNGALSASNCAPNIQITNAELSGNCKLGVCIKDQTEYSKLDIINLDESKLTALTITLDVPPSVLNNTEFKVFTDKYPTKNIRLDLGTQEYTATYLNGNIVVFQGSIKESIERWLMQASDKASSEEMQMLTTQLLSLHEQYTQDPSSHPTVMPIISTILNNNHQEVLDQLASPIRETQEQDLEVHTGIQAASEGPMGDRTQKIISDMSSRFAIIPRAIQQSGDMNSSTLGIWTAPYWGSSTCEHLKQPIDIKTGGFIIGIDRAISDTTVLGIAYNTGNSTNTQQLTSTKGKNSLNSVSFYGVHNVLHHNFIDWMINLGFSSHSYEAVRNISSVQKTVTSNHKSRSLTAQTEYNYTKNIKDACNLEMSGGFRYGSHSIDRYSQEGLEHINITYLANNKQHLDIIGSVGLNKVIQCGNFNIVPQIGIYGVIKTGDSKSKVDYLLGNWNKTLSVDVPGPSRYYAEIYGGLNAYWKNLEIGLEGSCGNISGKGTAYFGALVVRGEI